MSTFLLIAALIVMILSYVEANSTTAEAQSLYRLEQERQQCDSAIQQLMDGSDYLTLQVQQFVVQADREFMDNYWHEVNVTHSRDQALAFILNANLTEAEKASARLGKAESDSLITHETRAMRLVAESMGMSKAQMPREVAAYRLTPEEAAMSAADKQQAGIALIFGPTYSTYKNVIRANVNDFRNEIAHRYAEEMLLSLERTQEQSQSMKLLISGFLLVLLLTLAVYTTLVVLPIAGYAQELDQLDAGHPIRLRKRGVREIQRFVGVFNDLYLQVEENTRRLQRLGYFDYLTDVPNRASITEYVERAIEQKQPDLGLLMVDVDNFKFFNDTYGHAIGDRTLQEIAKAICQAQGELPGIAGRICGEEFVVVLDNATQELLAAVAERVLVNVRAITSAQIGLMVAEDYRVTVSIGATLWDGTSETNFIQLLSQADKALYLSKSAGKDRYTPPLNLRGEK